jgi:hypothetical protein
MKIILSRKGFDAAYGGVPSPILPSGEIYSLPIPENPAHHATYARCYGDLCLGAYTAGQFAEDLTRGRIRSTDRTHFDPDLNAAAVARPANWKPLFGQAGAAETHLRNQGVEAGDVFLFYGWFREVERAEGRFQYRRGAPNLHLLFGWLQIEARCPSADASRLPDWAQSHPHYLRMEHKQDSIYLSTDRLHLPGITTDLPGAGVFSHYHDALRLTAPGHTRSLWLLPPWFHPEGRPSALSYHGNPTLWTKGETGVSLQSVPKGQEFVLDSEYYPEAIGWLGNLLQEKDSRARW